MPRKGATVPAILALFDEGLGGLAAPASVVAEIFRQRAERQVELGQSPFVVSISNLSHTLDRLAKKGRLSRIHRPRGGPVYTHPRNLERAPGRRSMLERLPAIDLRWGPATTERRYEFREKRTLNALANEAILAGAHDFRYNFKTNQWHPCRTCGPDETGRFGPCKLRVATEEVAKKTPPGAGVQTSGSESASRAKS